jgi:hypothetical protein
MEKSEMKEVLLELLELWKNYNEKEIDHVHYIMGIDKILSPHEYDYGLIHDDESTEEV